MSPFLFPSNFDPLWGCKATTGGAALSGLKMDVAHVFEGGVPLWHGVVWDALSQIELDAVLLARADDLSAFTDAHNVLGLQDRALVLIHTK